MAKHIPVVEHVLSANDQIAQENLDRLNAHHIFAINIMASPGAGKTSVIEKTLERLGSSVRVAVVEGDTTACNIDSERVQQQGAFAVQINTGGNCHLEAQMIRSALNNISLEEIDLLIVENVGNLVCPAGWTLGTHQNVLVASVPEGDDKPYKYPNMYRGVHALIINKIDLLPYIPFKMDYFREGVEALNPSLATFPLSSITGEGFEAWIAWLQENLMAVKA